MKIKNVHKLLRVAKSNVSLRSCKWIDLLSACVELLFANPANKACSYIRKKLSEDYPAFQTKLDKLWLQ